MFDSATPWTAARQVSLSITNSRSLFKPKSIESVMPSNQLILCHPLLLPSIFPNIRVFSNESVLPIRWPKYWSFRFSISPSSEYSGLISFKIDWFDLLAVQGTLKNRHQHHSSKASVLWRSALYSPTVGDGESQYIVMRKHPTECILKPATIVGNLEFNPTERVGNLAKRAPQNYPNRGARELGYLYTNSQESLGLFQGLLSYWLSMCIFHRAAFHSFF